MGKKVWLCDTIECGHVSASPTWASTNRFFDTCLIVATKLCRLRFRRTTRRCRRRRSKRYAARFRSPRWKSTGTRLFRTKSATNCNRRPTEAVAAVCVVTCLSSVHTRKVCDSTRTRFLTGTSFILVGCTTKFASNRNVSPASPEIKLFVSYLPLIIRMVHKVIKVNIEKEKMSGQSYGKKKQETTDLP